MQNRLISSSSLARVAVLTLPLAAASAAAEPAPAGKKAAPAAKPRIDPTHFVVNDDDPEASMPTAEEANVNVIGFGNYLMDLSERTTAARARGDWPQALKYDRVLTRVAPENAGGFSAVCRDYEMLGRRQDAIEACGAALNKEGVKVDDFVRFVRLVANRHEGLDPVELEDAKAAIAHLKADPSSLVIGHQLQCELSLRSKDEAAFEQCATELSKLAPDEPQSITFAWSLAMQKRDYAQARAMLAKARGKNLGEEAIARMEQSMAAVEPEATGSTLGSAGAIKWIAGIGAGLLLLAAMIARRFRRTASA